MSKRMPAGSPESRENQLIALAVDLAEKQLSEGTASAQVITHYLKLGTQQAKLEQELIKERTKLVQAKVEAIEQAQRTEELYANAINAMKAYSGYSLDEDDEDDLLL